MLKLNLGCGINLKKGYINVDKYGKPDLLFNLENLTWPWEDNSVEEILLNHVLEHLGQETWQYFEIIQELYRICADGAKIDIVVPHPRHDDFISDPTHVRAITPLGLSLFSKTLNRKWAENHNANSQLALQLDVDFEIEKVNLGLEKEWADKLDSGKLTALQIHEIATRYNNVVKEIQVVLRVKK